MNDNLFQGTKAWNDGGAICARYSIIGFNGTQTNCNCSTKFAGNLAIFGGAIFAQGSHILAEAGGLTFLDNNAQDTGGALVIIQERNS